MEVVEGNVNIDPNQYPHQMNLDSQNEKEAVEKLKNAEWSPTNDNKNDEGYANTGNSVEGGIRRNIVHQRKADSVNTGSNKNQRSISQKVNKRKQQK